MANAKPPPPLDAHPEKPLVYASALILERRQRLLEEARKMIAEEGLENFSVRKLCQRAGVAPRTLYNAFQNKDRVIAIAIREAWEDFTKYVRYRTDPHTVEGIIDRAISVNRRNFRVRNYTKAVCAIYFGPNTSLDIWQTLHEMSVGGVTAWFETMQARGQIHPWIDAGHFAATMANIQYTVINDWCLGRLSDEEYLPRLTESMLLLLLGAVRGETRDEAEKLLINLCETGELPKFPAAIWSPPRHVIEAT